MFMQSINEFEETIVSTAEKEDGCFMLLSDISIERCMDYSFRISLFDKSTNSNRFLPIRSCNPSSHRRSNVMSLTKRASTISSDVVRVQTKVGEDVLACNGYLRKFRIVHFRLV